MSAVGQFSPQTGNLMVGKGFFIFKPVGETAFYHMGNCTEAVFTPTIEKLEHFSSMEGTKEKDLIIVLSKNGTTKLTLEEQTKRNLAMIMLGDITEDSYGIPEIEIFSRDSLSGNLRYYATNNQGPRWFVDLYSVQFNPSGGWNPISSEIGNMEVTGDWNALDGSFGIMRLLPAIGESAPANVIVPFISGIPAVGEILTASFGAWLGGPSYTYLWKANGGSAANTATAKTYTVGAGDSGKVMTVEVTASNSVGDTLYISAPTTAVT